MVSTTHNIDETSGTGWRIIFNYDGTISVDGGRFNDILAAHVPAHQMDDFAREVAEMAARSRLYAPAKKP